MAKTIAIIGCGGVAAHMLPALIHQYNLILVDGDAYEPKNVVRQLAAHAGKGKNKAETLRDMYAPMTDKKIIALPKYLRDTTKFPVQPDLLMVLVDNNDARCYARAQANSLFIPLIWAANEEYDPQAMLYTPEREGTTLDPFVRYSVEPDGQGPGEDCNSQAAVDERPQLPVANNLASAFGLAILHCMETIAKEDNWIAEIIGVENRITSKRFRDLEEEAKAVALEEKAMAVEAEKSTQTSETK
jgi:hypothetical protein